MKYLKIFEEFVEELTKTKSQQLSDVTVDDVLKDDFFDDKSFIDNNGVIHIMGWKYY